jgi:flagellar hook-length control protein FliK
LPLHRPAPAPGDAAPGTAASDAAAAIPPGAAPVLASSFIAAPAETPAGFVAAPLAPDQAAVLEEIVAATAATATTADTAFTAMRAAPATQQSGDGAAVSQPADVVENNGKPQQGATTAQTAEARQAAKAAIAAGVALDMPVQTAEQVASESPAPSASAPEKKSSGKSSDAANSDASKSTAATLPAATAKPVEAPVPQTQTAQAAAQRADAPAVQAAPAADTGTSSVNAQTSTLSVAGIAPATTGSAVAQPPRTELPVRLTGLAGDSEGMDALAVRIAVRAAAGDNRFDIRLDPPELGRIDVRLDVDKSGQVQAQLSAERPQTLDLLQRDSHALERALRDAGLNAGGGLSFSLKGEGRSGRDRDAEGSRNYARIGAVDELAGVTPALATRWQPNYLGADTRLDITV